MEELPIVMERKRKRQRIGEWDSEDVISNLPEFLIHQIMSYLPPKEAARTTVLSKAWLQSYSTSPFLSFNERFFFVRAKSRKIEENRYPLCNFINKTLLRYTSLNLRIQKLQINVSWGYDYDPAYLLVDDSLGVAFDNGVEDLNIIVKKIDDFACYTLPSAMFESPKRLIYLSVVQCKFPQNVVSNPPCRSIIFPFLRTLILRGAYIDDGMLQKLLSSSPSLEEIVFFVVSGFNKFRVCNLGKLKILNILSRKAIVIDVEDAPSLCLLEYKYRGFSFERSCLLKVGNSLQSLNLKRLKLCSVSISDNSLKDLIKKSPLLEDLLIDSCDELEKVNILSSSLKHLDFKRCKMLVGATIDAPNLLELRYTGKYIFSVSLNNTPDNLKTIMRINNFEHDHLSNTWIKQLGELLKAVNQARIYIMIWNFHQGIEFSIAHDSRENPLPLEHQTENFMPHVNQSSSLFVVFVETLFSSSRPTTIDTRLGNSELVKFLRNEQMATKRNPDCCGSDQTKCWRHYLKDIEVEVEVYEDSQKVWQPLLQESSLSKIQFCGRNIRFSFKWHANLNFVSAKTF